MMISKIRIACLLISALPLLCFAQENSPYSRYGVGNLVAPSNIANRAMGGISAGYTDAVSVNSVNAATYSNFIYTTLDIGMEYDALNLKSKDPIGVNKSKYAIIPYLQFGFPLLRGNKKAIQKNKSWGLAFGLKPISRINYKILSNSSNSVDSTSTSYEGNGGINEAFIGTGIRFNKFSIGFNTGYLFGEKNYDSRLSFDNDTVDYYKAHYGTQTNFGGVFLNGGIQYADSVGKGVLRLGVYGNLKQKFNASKDYVVETFNYSNNSGAPLPIDSVYHNSDQKGKVQLPSSFGAGFTYTTDHLLVGADFENTKWDEYRFYGQKDFVKNSWNARFGMQYLPASLGSTGYFSFVKYRAGFSFGQDYIDIDKSLPVYNVSIGASLPLKLKRSFYDYQYSIMNVTFEYGSRGNNKNNITENLYKISIGFSLSDLWFRRQVYE